MKAWFASSFSLLLCTSLAGCASSWSARGEPARGTIDLSARAPELPVASSSPFGTPYGERTGLRASEARVDLEPYLLAAPPQARVERSAPARHEVSKVRRQRLQRLSRSRIPAPPSAYAFASEPAPAPTPTNVQPAPNAIEIAPAAQLGTPPPSPDADRYAAREAQSRSVQEFRGGDAIVITSGAILVALLIVLLILLLT